MLYQLALSWEAAPTVMFAVVICFSSFEGSVSYLAIKDQPEVCPLSSGIMFQSLSIPLQDSIRFLWKVNCYGKLSGLNPRKRRSETLIAFHNTLPCSDAINLSGTVNLPGRRVGGNAPSMASIFTIGSA